jgi:hypothetical protein
LVIDQRYTKYCIYFHDLLHDKKVISNIENNILLTKNIFTTCHNTYRVLAHLQSNPFSYGQHG